MPSLKQTMMRASLLCAFAYFWAMASKMTEVSIMQDTEASEQMPSTPKAFQAASGNGWCVNSAGGESKARRFVKLSCRGALNMCENDNMCVAFACEQARGRSVIYSSEDCEADCGDLDWVRDPTLIVNASREAAVQIDMYASWANGICYVQAALTTLSAAASPGSTSFSVANSAIFAVGDGVRISTTEVKSITQVSSGTLVVATPLKGSYRAGLKVMKVGSNRQVQIALKGHAAGCPANAAGSNVGAGCSCNAG